MFTVCPGCTRQFRIYAEHIAAASGQVRCGFCHEQFNALGRLHDEPLSNENILNNIQLAPELDPDLEVEPEFDISVNDEPGIIDSEHDVLITNNEVNVDQELKTAIDEIGIISSVEEIKTGIKNEITENKASEPVEKELKETHYEFPEAEEILVETQVKRGWISTVFWTTASLVALIAISLQLAWFNRDGVLMQYPQLKPHVKQICKELGCRVIRQRDARAIKLVNRDVRLHPDYQDTLLVNATMKNELYIPQPYPRVQLTLFDTSGALLGYREFAPSDYLDNSIEIDEGMPVDYPVHFVLEVSGPTAGAVSFEFRFL
jgi:predicted Zn finger-like uncharacterized protein